MVSFEASVPSFEEVKAKTASASCTLLLEKAEIMSLVPIKAFHFKVPLMQEHFNENYMESNIFPKATFKGIIENFDLSKLTATPQQHVIKGKIKLRGKSKKITMIAYIKKNADGIDIDSGFALDIADFGIDIPSIVSNKVSRKVNVKIDYTLK